MNQYNINICGYRLCNRPQILLTNTVIMPNGNGNITVRMARKAVDYILGCIIKTNLKTEPYLKAIKVLKSVKKILNNQTPERIAKEECKMVIDVLEEIKKQEAKSEQERCYHAKMAYICRELIEARWQC